MGQGKRGKGSTQPAIQKEGREAHSQPKGGNGRRKEDKGGNMMGKDVFLVRMNNEFFPVKRDHSVNTFS